MIEPRLYKGMRDYLPEMMIPRERLLSRIKKTFQAWGFVPIETPAIEYTEILTGKYGEEAQKLIYHIQHEDGLALRYDLTVPLSRMYALNSRELPRPFKRYQIQPVWRAERAQPRQGRFREFYQCVVDILGTKSIMADTEIVALSAGILSDIGFSRIDVQVNHRQLLKAMVGAAAFPKRTKPLSLYRLINSIRLVKMAY
jgi:histidyl-tRNA synthetase